MCFGWCEFHRFCDVTVHDTPGTLRTPIMHATIASTSSDLGSEAENPPPDYSGWKRGSDYSDRSANEAWLTVPCPLASIFSGAGQNNIGSPVSSNKLCDHFSFSFSDMDLLTHC